MQREREREMIGMETDREGNGKSRRGATWLIPRGQNQSLKEKAVTFRILTAQFRQAACPQFYTRDN